MTNQACLYRQRRWGALAQSRKSISTTAIELLHLVLGLRAKRERGSRHLLCHTPSAVDSDCLLLTDCRGLN